MKTKKSTANKSVSSAGERTTAPDRITHSLDGQWSIAESMAADDRPTTFVRTVPVPGLVNLAQPPFAQVDEFEGYELNESRIRMGEIPESERVSPPGRSLQPRNYFWYRTAFWAPAGKSVARLTINKAQFGMAVWLNGHPLGEEPACYSSGRFDLTGAIRWDEENELIVRIGAHPAVLPASYPTGTDFEKFRWTPGIYDSVSVAFCNNPVVHDVQVAPRLKPPAIVVQTKLGNLSSAPCTVALAQRVRDWRSGAAVTGVGLEAVQLEAGEEKIVMQTIPLPENARPWSPDDPFLYVLETGTGGDAVETRFGLREFRSDAATGQFYLNGQPCRLRGSNIGLHRFLEDPDCGALPWNDTWVRRLLTDIPRQMHWNALRFHIGPVPQRWLDIADESGLLIQNEFFMWTSHPKWHPGYSRSWDADELIRQYSAWMRDNWNHPSLVIWDACNETFDPVLGEKVIPAVRGLDLSDRPWDNGYNPPVGPNDPAEIHPYFHASSHWEKRLLHHTSDLETKTFKQVVEVGVAEQNQTGHPLIINEYGWLWLNRDGSPTALTARLYDMLLGPNATAEERFRFYAYTVALETEFFRASRCYAGILHFVYLTCSHPKAATSDSFRDIRTLEWEPHFADYMAEAFKPLGVCLHFFQPMLAAGTDRAFTIKLVNDDKRAACGTLALTLETAQGEVLVRTESEFAVEAFGQADVELGLAVPVVLGPHVLKATAGANGAAIAPTISRRFVDVVEAPCSLVIPLQPDEKWWGGRVLDSAVMPYSGAAPVRRSLHAEGSFEENQVQPLLLSNRGRYVWNEGAFDFELSENALRLSRGSVPWQTGIGGATLRDAFRTAARRFFPPSGRMPAEILFTAPQYNTWIELLHDQTEDKILHYARSIVANGYPPGVLMIDDNWQENYGVWEFSPRRFSDPKGMIRELHALGFQVMLWVCPFVSADSSVYRELVRKRWLLRESAWVGQPAPLGVPSDAAMIRWWNGVSGVLDLSHPEARTWFKGRLDRLQREFSIDGFKFDAGDSGFYLPLSGDGRFGSHLPRTPQEHTAEYARIGLEYPLNEYRACWQLAGQPLGQRLRDKDHSWSALRDLMPATIAQGLMGYAFSCPDLIGGGLAGAFENLAKFDYELVVRSAQVHALMPMMQFSAAPWRVLDPENARHCLDAARLHARHGSKFLDLARQAAATGEPIVRPLAWEWPEGGYEDVRDQFMLGDEILVAPVVEQGARSRVVIFPPGRWLGDDGSMVEGPSTQAVAAPLSRLPFFVRQK